MLTRLYVLHALSPLHAGTGQGVGLIDLPIARERTTEHPLVPGSSVKGVLRQAARDAQEARVDEFFGSEAGTDPGASMIRVSDARILAFPVRSDRGTFAWVTSRYVLLRLLRDAGADAGFTAAHIPNAPDGQAMTGDEKTLVDTGKLTLDGLPFTRTAPPDGAVPLWDHLPALAFPEEDATSLAWRAFFRDRLTVVSDDAFTWFVETATDVRAHIRIGTNGTVAPRALWYQESLPPESVLVGLLQVAAVRRGQRPEDALALIERIAGNPLQVGGSATTGAGQVRLSIVEAA